ncbi:MAG: universal stress protein [Dehalococcoidia bacterium]|nr:MAG: universal stress protein [Dehalococcoidia bacterium]
MYERILVPLDGSELAEAALPYAEELAGRLGSEVILIHAYESDDEKYRRMHQLYLQKIVEATKRGVKSRLGTGEKGEARVDSALLIGHPAEQIVEYADRESIGLILMATHGRSGIKRWVLGDVAAKVARATKGPVALIRVDEKGLKASKKAKISNIILPLDGSKESEAAIRPVEELASKLKANVVLLHVIAPTYFVYSIPGETVEMPLTAEDMQRSREKAEHYLETVAAAFQKKGVNTRIEVIVGAAADQILSLADEIPADMVAMSTHGRSGISRWAFGSITDKVLHAANTPVLLIRESGGNKKKINNPASE